jgi:hypothetical protein
MVFPPHEIKVFEIKVLIINQAVVKMASHVPMGGAGFGNNPKVIEKTIG